MNEICVCQIEREFGEDAAVEAVKRDVFHGKRVLGHWNEAGGYCCPHHGNTCGFHEEYGRNSQEQD